MSTNTLLNPTIIASETLLGLEEGGVMMQHVHTQYKNEFAKVGDTITIRLPNVFRASMNDAIQLSDISERSTTLVLDTTHTQTAFEFSGRDLTLTVDEFSKRYSVPAGEALATKTDVDLCAKYVDVANSVGTPGITPNTFRVLGLAQALLSAERAPTKGRVGMFNADAIWAIGDAMKGTFAPTVANEIVTKGFYAHLADLSLYQEQNVAIHTTGHFTSGATPVMNGTTASGATSIVTNGWSGSNTVKKGDVFTIAGVYATDPLNGLSTGRLRQFVVTADTADTGADMTIPIFPAIISSGPYQTVNAVPLTTAALTFMGSEDTSYPQNLVYHPNAFALVTVPIEVPSNEWGARMSTKSGLSLRAVKQYSITTDKEAMRFDVLAGKKTLDPAFAVRVWG
ncbi:MAG: P22-like coat protein gene protein [Podoviridae sp. cty5g4]|nr:MAG: P22-like coat protein gene protein [Podoviridae sp. cty5g4]